MTAAKTISYTQDAYMTGGSDGASRNSDGRLDGAIVSVILRAGFPSVDPSYAKRGRCLARRKQLIVAVP